MTTTERKRGTKSEIALLLLQMDGAAQETQFFMGNPETERQEPENLMGGFGVIKLINKTENVFGQA